ncbi:MAG: tetratricopeptide repeat protein, partial [Gammaproteobacteria bacterium]
MKMRTILHLCMLAVVAPLAHAYDFRPTAAEWGTWPEYCQAKYVVTNVGSTSSFRSRVSAEVVDHWRRALGEEVWLPVHHGCAGFIWILRAERLRGKAQREYDFALGKAVDESMYTLQRIPPSHPVHQKLRLVLARVEHHRGNVQNCFTMLDQLLAEVPEMAEAYSVYATYLYRDKQFERARAVLERGLDEVPEPTAEMHYFLGLVLLRQKAYEEARVQ